MRNQPSHPSRAPAVGLTVLQRRSSDEQSVIAVESAHDSREERVLILDTVSLIDVLATSSERKQSAVSIEVAADSRSAALVLV